MGDFSQNGIVSTLHDFKTKSTDEIEKELLEFSKERKMELILPCLYSELEGEALPKIVSEISKTKYLNHIIICQINHKGRRHIFCYFLSK